MLERISSTEIEVRCDGCNKVIDVVSEEEAAEMGCGYAQCSICWELYG